VAPIGGTAAFLTAFAMLAVQGVQAQKPSREDVQAAYLYNFAKFGRWPQEAERGPLTICVAGENSFRQAMGKLIQGDAIGGRAVEERDLESAAGVGGCSILFVGTGNPVRDESYLAAARGKPILTVGEGQDFLAHGGMIQFVPVGDHVRFAVNLEAVNRNGIALSSELLKVAVSVTGTAGTGGAQ
jgi:hypothetical protein